VLGATVRADDAVGWPRGVPGFDELFLRKAVPILDFLSGLGRDGARQLTTVFDCVRSVDFGRLDVEVWRRMLIWIDFESQAVEALYQLPVFE
jgi:hypothetical protein